LATAYVIGGYIPNGGTRIAFALGEVAHEHLGMDVRIVQIAGETPSSRFQYKHAFPQLSLDEMKAAIRPTDLLVCNPSFSSLGLDAISAQKVMYVQGFNTFQDIPRGFECYVAVSSYVRNFMRDAHDLDMPVVPPFIEDASVAAIDTTHPRDGVLIYIKQGLVAGSVEPLVNSLAGVNYRIWTEGPNLDLRRAMRDYSVFCYVSRPEGFGLAPLEAMAEGAIVVSTDTRGGRDYLLHGENAFVIPAGQSAAAAPYVRQTLANPDAAIAMRAAAQKTAEHYDWHAFSRRWAAILGQLLDGKWDKTNAGTWRIPN
jgi:glycosyltransferase involved in cell wall biosynthesis